MRALSVLSLQAMVAAAVAFGVAGSSGCNKPKEGGKDARERPMAFLDKAIGERELGVGDHDAYAHRADNPFHRALDTPLSTFSIDVDTASYSNVRRFLLSEGRLPPPDAVRIEECINYFNYDDPAPALGVPVRVNTEVGPCVWSADHKVVRIGLRAASIPVEVQPARNLVFLVDTSGSMSPPDRLPLLVQGLKLLVDRMRPEDRVAIVAYAGSAGLVLPSTPGTQRQVIRDALGRLQAGGSTNGGEGLVLAYQVAQDHFIADGINRVIIGTDGDFNVGVRSDGELVRLIEEKRKSRILLSVLGFGRGNLKDATMEKLAHHGNGHYAYIDSLREAQRLFVDQGAALQLVATDVKVQVEFNPALVQAYRLIGYENRLLAARDFNDDSKDAGDLGSGHTVTALYEIVPTGIPFQVPGVDTLKYQKPANVLAADFGKELLTVKVRYKDPGAEHSNLLSQPVEDAKRTLDETSADFRFASAVAAWGMLLRDSPHKGQATYAETLRLAQRSLGADLTGNRAEFVRMIQSAQRLAGRE